MLTDKIWKKNTENNSAYRTCKKSCSLLIAVNNKRQSVFGCYSCFNPWSACKNSDFFVVGKVHWGWYCVLFRNGIPEIHTVFCGYVHKSFGKFSACGKVHTSSEKAYYFKEHSFTSRKKVDVGYKAFNFNAGAWNALQCHSSPAKWNYGFASINFYAFAVIEQNSRWTLNGYSAVPEHLYIRHCSHIEHRRRQSFVFIGNSFLLWQKNLPCFRFSFIFMQLPSYILIGD